jgi:antitoxin CptB
VHTSITIGAAVKSANYDAVRYISGMIGECTMQDRDTRIKQLRYRAWRRGFREHDFLMGTYADTKLAQQDDAGLDAFEALLDQADWDVYYWIVGQKPVPQAFQSAIMLDLQAMKFTVETIRAVM